MWLLISIANILADKNPLMSISFIIHTCIRSGEEVLADECSRSGATRFVEGVADPVSLPSLTL